MSLKPYTFITDIGSTTTKGILIDNANARLLGITHANTTVEAPLNDVSIGVKEAALTLEKQTGIRILGTGEGLDFSPDINYQSTSSAGGGLQILVIGLTLFDSASSAKRAAYGAGGVILDVFAIDDKRTAVEQMLSMRNLRPDMILISGGTDGGALSGVLRMAEILRIARPLPKYASDSKIPTIYAGNQQAAPMIRNMISEDFELYTLPNLRPTLAEENLKPTQEKVQELFMQRVMERAPGYAKVKDIVAAEILPTPLGVLNSITRLQGQNVLLFDIGGATTDVFSRINGHLQRTVSANLGMSYSMLNVLKESGIAFIQKLLPSSIKEATLRNYIGNKSLFPTSDPQSQMEYRIEHAIAKAAIHKAFEQHKDMHFNIEKLGYLDRVRADNTDRFREKFSYIADENMYSFSIHEIQQLIGAGGVFAHAQNYNQCLDILISGYQPTGICEIAIDRHFISPHLGVFNDLAAGDKLLAEECILPLALYIRPSFPPKQKKAILKVAGDITLEVLPDSFIYLPAKAGCKLKIEPQKNCALNASGDAQELRSDLPIIIDTRWDRMAYSKQVEATLSLYLDDADAVIFVNKSMPVRGNHIRSIELPYKGEILVSENERVSPEQVVGLNQYNPPRLFVIPVFSDQRKLTAEQRKASMSIKLGEYITFNQELARPIPEAGIRHSYISPVRGKVEYIEYASGIVVASEIQDYSLKPVKIDIAAGLGLKGKKAHAYLTKKLGDFVYEGDLLARKLDSKGLRMVQAPSTGEITGWERNTGIMTIQYRGKAHEFKSLVQGKVKSVEAGRAAEIEFDATLLEASIGWGAKLNGTLRYFRQSPLTVEPESIVVLAEKPHKRDFEELLKLQPLAIVIPSMEESWLLPYLGGEQGVINTGFESVATSLILMQGFGDLSYSVAQRDYFLANEGCSAFIDPHTRIRAGVARAGIYILDSK